MHCASPPHPQTRCVAASSAAPWERRESLAALAPSHPMPACITKANIIQRVLSHETPIPSFAYHVVPDAHRSVENSGNHISGKPTKKNLGRMEGCGENGNVKNERIKMNCNNVVTLFDFDLINTRTVIKYESIT
jgi:hypothetical protein